MSMNGRYAGNVLVASGSSTDAAMVRSLLTGTIDSVTVSTDSAKALEDFERARPRVLVLAFRPLGAAQAYLSSLQQPGGNGSSVPRRSVVLCDKAELNEAAQLCLDQTFDDYVLFWPLNHDAPRLRVSVSHALRELATLENAGPSAAEFAEQARRIALLEGLLNRSVRAAREHGAATGHAIERAGKDIGAALDGFSRRLDGGAPPEGGAVQAAQDLGREFERMRRDEIQPPLQTVAESVVPLRRWAEEFGDECAPHIASIQALSAMAAQVPFTILVVDDDEPQRVLAAKILQSPNRRIVFATSGNAALVQANRTPPDLILMDIQMPGGMGGIKATRRLKLSPKVGHIPVIMLSAASEASAVKDSLKAGASDYLVKPIDKNQLVAKVTRWLGRAAPPR
jgi:CheY-like chemotaxis protein